MLAGGALTVPSEKPSDAKRALRTQLIAVRARLSPEERQRRSRAIAERLDALDAFRSASTVALYAPLGTEADLLPVARSALARGVRVAFPRAVTSDRRLVFARCDPTELVRGPLGADEPPPRATAVEPSEIECVVMPGVAFSSDGLRLGRGGGYYDATLRSMPRAVRVGVGYDVQVVAALPREAHDAQLDVLVTDERVLLFPRDRR